MAPASKEEGFPNVSDNKNAASAVSRRQAIAGMAAFTAACAALPGYASAMDTVTATGTAANKAGEKPVKVVWMIKRKHGVSVEKFRAAYRHHISLIEEHLGSTFTEYRLNFPNEAFGGIQELSANKGYISGPVPVDYDCITEMLCPNRAAYEEGLKIATTPGISELIDADENKFIDHETVITWLCDELKVI